MIPVFASNKKILFKISAKWETPQAWIDQESRYEFCDAVLCKCPNEDGRNYVDDDDWEVGLINLGLVVRIDY